MCGLVEELLAKVGLSVRRLGYHEQSAGVLVYTVYQSHLGVVGVEGLHVSQMPCHGIDERTVEVAGTGMYHEACRLVDHHQHIVLIDNIEWYVLRNDGVVVSWTVEHQRYHIARPDLVVALHGLAVDMYEARIGSRLYAVAAGVLHVLGQELVYPQWCLPLVHLQFPVLVQLLSVPNVAQLVEVVCQFKIIFHHQPIFLTTGPLAGCCDEEFSCFGVVP